MENTYFPRTGIKMGKTVVFCAAALLFLLLFSIPARADIGPKPSVLISLEGLDGEPCYGTLLSKTENSGPYQHLDTGAYARYEPGDKDYEIYQKFVEYQDADGFYYLQFLDECTETGGINWDYFPPVDFKVLLYFPEQDRFVVSDTAYESYAFHSFYRVDVSAVVEAVREGEEATFTARPQYRYGREAAALLVRIFLTIAIELGIALAFGLRERKQLVFLAEVNAATQIILNVLVSVVNYKEGALALVLCYILLEGIVLFIELLAYVTKLRWISDKSLSIGKAVYYTLAANAASFIVGFWMALLIPIFF